MNDSLLDLEAHPCHCLFMLYTFINDLLLCNNIFTRPARLSPRSTSCLGWSWTTAGCPPKERQRTVNYNSDMETVTQPEIADQTHSRMFSGLSYRDEVILLQTNHISNLDVSPLWLLKPGSRQRQPVKVGLCKHSTELWRPSVLLKKTLIWPAVQQHFRFPVVDLLVHPMASLGDS